MTGGVRQPRLTRIDVQALEVDQRRVSPRDGLRTVVALHRLAARLEVVHVDRARAEGMSWAEIARELQVTKQTVHKKHGSRHRGGATREEEP